MKKIKKCRNCKKNFRRNKYLNAWQWKVKIYCTADCKQTFNQKKQKKLK